MKKYYFLFFILGMITYNFIPTDIMVAQARPINVTQTQIHNVDDDSGCISVTKIDDKELQTGERITAHDVEVCK